MYANSKQYTLALEQYRAALEIYTNAGLPDDHPSLANTAQWVKWAEKRIAKSTAKDAIKN